MRTMAHEVLELEGKYFVLVLHTTEQPDPAEWAAYIRDYVAIAEKCEWGPALVGSLAITDGGGPIAAQRKEIVEKLSLSLAAGNIRGGAVTNSAVVRGILTALNWVSANKKIRAFAPTQLTEVLEHYGLPATARAPLLLAISELAHKLPVKTAAAILACNGA